MSYKAISHQLPPKEGCYVSGQLHQSRAPMCTHTLHPSPWPLHLAWSSKGVCLVLMKPRQELLFKQWWFSQSWLRVIYSCTTWLAGLSWHPRARWGKLVNSATSPVAGDGRGVGERVEVRALLMLVGTRLAPLLLEPIWVVAGLGSSGKLVSSAAVTQRDAGHGLQMRSSSWFFLLPSSFLPRQPWGTSRSASAIKLICKTPEAIETCKNYIETEFHSSKYGILLFSPLISPYPAWINPMLFGLKYACGHNSFFTQITT